MKATLHLLDRFEVCIDLVQILGKQWKHEKCLYSIFFSDLVVFSIAIV